MGEEASFPVLSRSISAFIEDEEGSIPAQKVVVIGAMMIVLTAMLSREAFAVHRSHASHKSHASTSYVRSHGNHGSHSSHDSHESHGSHTSHSNSIAHSNSNYSAAGDNGAVPAPAASSIPGVSETAQVGVSQKFDINKLLDGIEFSSDPGSTSVSADGATIPDAAFDAIKKIASAVEPPATLPTE